MNVIGYLRRRTIIIYPSICICDWRHFRSKSISSIQIINHFISIRRILWRRHIKTTKIYVEDEYVRAVRGGVGFAKVAGNYAASLLAQTNANNLGYDQVLWLDGVEQKYVEEVGSMNIFFVENGKLVTPALNGSILPGITRKSIIELAKELGYEAEERKVSIDNYSKLTTKVNWLKYSVQVQQQLFLQSVH